MYSIPQKNQASNKKNPNNLRYLSEKTQLESVLKRNTGSKDLLTTIASYRGKGKIIFDYIFKNRHLDFIQLKNETIAKALGCSPRTVQRWTAQFVKDGMFSKYQANRYTPNTYTVHISKNGSFSYWLNNLPEAQQDLYLTHGITFAKKNSTSLHPETVVQSYNSNLNNNIYIQTTTFSVRAREDIVLPAVDRQTIGATKYTERYNRVMKAYFMLKKEQKEWLLKHKDQPGMKKYFMSDDIRSRLITPVMKEIQTETGMSESDVLKLISFDDETLKFGQNRYRDAKYLKDIVGFLMVECTNYCRVEKKEPDWKWYYMIRDLMDLSDKSPAIEWGTKPTPTPPYAGKSVYRDEESQPQFKSDAYKKFDGHKHVKSQYTSELEACKQRLAKFDSTMNLGFLGNASSMIEQERQKVIARIKELENII